MLLLGVLHSKAKQPTPAAGSMVVCPASERGRWVHSLSTDKDFGVEILDAHPDPSSKEAACSFLGHPDS